MSLLDRIMRAFLGEPDPFSLENIPESALDVADWRDEAVKRAAQRHGSAFKCGPDGVPRERFVGKAMQKEIVKPTATVTQIRRKQTPAKEK